MFFINPYYEPQVLTSAQKSKRALQIQSLLMMPKQSRTGAIKRELYEYFIKHPKLIQIESTKSLRARIMCVGEIQLITEQQYVQVTFPQTSSNHKQKQTPNKINSIFTILTKFQHDSTLAVIKTQTINSIMLHNEESIKKMMLEIKKFSFLKQFEYHELLYLAHFVQKHKSVSYKNYVFEEKDGADFVYFIEEGEFQVFKNLPELTLIKEKSLKKIKKPRESSPLNKFLQNQQSPYKMKKIKVNKEQLSKIQGGSGQCFGQIEFFLQSSNRQFSLRCNSLTSKMFKIHFKHFQQIFAFKIIRFNKLKRQYKQKYESDMIRLKMHRKIKDRMGSPQPKLTQEQQQNNALNQKVSSIILQMDNFKSLDQNQLQGAFTLPNNSLTIPVSQLNAKRNIYRDKKLYSENGKKMAVKEGNRYGSQLRAETNMSIGQYEKSVESRGTSLDRPFFPLINQKKFSKMGQSEGKNNLQQGLASRKNNKVKGLIDISVIIEQKQKLNNSLTGNLNPQFSFYKLDEKNLKRLNFQKSQLLKPSSQHQQKISTHSKHYLKQFVRNSLKNSKYYHQVYTGPKNRNIYLQKLRSTKTQEIINTTSFSIQEQGDSILSQRYREIDEPQYTLSKEIRDSLVSNEVDKFFKQI